MLAEALSIVAVLDDAAAWPVNRKHDIYFTMPEIQRACETLWARGVAFETMPHLVAARDQYKLWLAFFRDVDQNLLAIMCEVPRS
jgi:hypothetical protein